MGAGGCGIDVSRPQKPITVPDTINLGLRKIATSEVAKHNQPGDSWIIIKNKVYDISEFAKVHPGGNVILTYAGKDATDVFSVFHTSSTWSLLPQYAIGEHVAEEVVSDVVKDFRELRQRLLQKRFFESNKSYYAFKVLSTLALLCSSILLISVLKSWTSVFISAVLLGLSFQQTGWLAHDFLHHQVFDWRPLNNIVGGIILGNLLQGFSFSWWKAKHNKHHAAPNECDHHYNAVDPDIDTLPLLAWSKNMISTVENKTVRYFLRWQSYFLFPMLLLARFAWLHSSLMFAINAEMSLKHKIVEQGTLLVHFVGLLLMAFCLLPVPMALFWLLFSQAMGGLFLGIVFVQSHNGKEVYNDIKDFFTAQVVSTRDVKSNVVNDWFTGGLNMQIEHHLFPTMPRHNLGIVSKEVRALCKKHGLAYDDVGMAEGTRLVLKCLSEVASFA